MIGKNQCKHWQLARSCEICELERENEELRSRVCDECLEYKDDGTPYTSYGWYSQYLREENEKLQAPFIYIDETGWWVAVDEDTMKKLADFIKANH